MSEVYEISSQEYKTLMAAKESFEKLYNHKEKGTEFKRFLKEVNPDVSIPELDIIDRVTKPAEEKYNALAEEFRTFKQSLETKSEERKFEKQLDAVRQKEGLDDAQWKKVINRMQEKNNPDVEAAAAWVKSTEYKAKPTSSSNYSPESFNAFGTDGSDASMDMLFKNPERYQNDEINNIMNNPENYRESGGSL